MDLFLGLHYWNCILKNFLSKKRLQEYSANPGVCHWCFGAAPERQRQRQAWLSDKPLRQIQYNFIISSQQDIVTWKYPLLQQTPNGYLNIIIASQRKFLNCWIINWAPNRIRETSSKDDFWWIGTIVPEAAPAICSKFPSESWPIFRYEKITMQVTAFALK